MKKLTIISLVVLLTCGTAMSSFAQSAPAAVAKKAKVKNEVITGKILAIDVAKNTIVLKEGKAGTEKTISVDPKVIATLKVNEEVKVTLKGTENVALSVKEVIKKTKSTKK